MNDPVFLSSIAMKTAYDAYSLALAEALDGTLLTTDGGLAARARRSLGEAAVLEP